MLFKHLHWISHRFGTSLRKRGFIAFTKSVATGSIAIGCIALLLSLAVLDGFQESLEKLKDPPSLCFGLNLNSC